MAAKSTEEDKSAKLYPAVSKYEPCSVTDLTPGDTKYWCVCGLSKNQPWCDGSHADTGFTPLKWTVEKDQKTFYFCACKYTKNPPFCDGTHAKVSSEVLQRQKDCPSKTDKHCAGSKLCTGCGWVPDF